MRNRKVIVTAFLLVAVMLLGVGYAAVSDTLDIQGTADINATDAGETLNEDVYFTGVMNGSVMVDAITPEDGLGYTAHINSQDNDMAHFTVSCLKAKDDHVTITYVVRNDSSNNVTLSLKNSSTTEDIFTVETELDDGATKVIPAGGTETVWVTISLNADPTGAITGAFVIGILATN